MALRARSGAASESIRTRSPAVSFAYSGMSSIRRYSGLVKRRLIGRYGDWLSGGSGSPACSGLIRMNPAPRSLALQAARSARSPRSPCPHDWRERSEYSWTAKPQDRSSGPGTTGCFDPRAFDPRAFDPRAFDPVPSTPVPSTPVPSSHRAFHRGAFHHGPRPWWRSPVGRGRHVRASGSPSASRMASSVRWLTSTCRPCQSR